AVVVGAGGFGQGAQGAVPDRGVFGVEPAVDVAAAVQAAGGLDPGVLVAARGVVGGLVGAVAFGDDVADAAAGHGEFRGGEVLVDHVEQDAFGGGAVGVVQAGDGVGDGGGVAERQITCGPALDDLAEAVPLAGQGEAFFGAGVAHAQAVAQPGLGGRIAPSLGLTPRIDDADQARQSRLLEVDRGGEGLGQLQAFRSGFGCGTVGEFGGDLRQQRHQFTGGRLFNPKICR